MKTEDVKNIVILGGIAYVIYLLAPSFKKGTGAVADWIAQFYEWATFPPAIVPLGNIVLPGGMLIPLTSVDVRQMPNGGTAALYAGVVYQLSPSDNNGNWPASPL